jgi:hypothetical protein
MSNTIPNLKEKEKTEVARSLRRCPCDSFSLGPDNSAVSPDATVPSFVPTTKPYGGLPVVPTLLRSSPQVFDAVQSVSRWDSSTRKVTLSA